MASLHDDAALPSVQLMAWLARAAPTGVFVRDMTAWLLRGVQPLRLSLLHILKVHKAASPMHPLTAVAQAVVAVARRLRPLLVHCKSYAASM
jgi:hypothetical protein